MLSNAINTQQMHDTQKKLEFIKLMLGLTKNKLIKKPPTYFQLVFFYFYFRHPFFTQRTPTYRTYI